MSGRQLCLVRWDIPSPRSHGNTHSRVFRQRQSAVRWLLTMQAEGNAAELFSTPMPQWEPLSIPAAVRKRHAAFVRHRVERRAFSRVKWANR